MPQGSLWLSGGFQINYEADGLQDPRIAKKRAFLPWERRTHWLFAEAARPLARHTPKLSPDASENENQRGSDSADFGCRELGRRYAGEDPCSRTIDAPERAKDATKDASTAEGKSAAPGPSAQPTEWSSPERFGAQTTPTSDSPVRYPSIAVVVPPPPWKQRATRASARAAAAACNRRLRSDQGTGKHQDPVVSFPDTEQLGQKVKKRRPAKRPFSKPPGPSIPASCRCSGDIHGVRGSALLTVDSNSGLKPAYYLTFTPGTSPMLSRPPTADIPGKPKPYSSDENALLVRLKEREAMPWSEITAHFPGRNASSLQVHYSTKLRHKARSWSGRR